MNEIAILVKQTRGVDEYGDPVTDDTGREVFVREKSIGQKEFYQAQAVGLQPEITLVLADYLDYEGEQYVKYTPLGQTTEQLYRVLRTYRAGVELELVCYREVNPA
jgi:SPP1 family predicted phage head-tail adaptor